MTDFWSLRNEGRDETHVAAGYGRDFAKRVRSGNDKEKNIQQYASFRDTFFHDPKLNTRLKTADVQSGFNLGVDNSKAWKTTGKTWSRETRFPRGRCAMDKPVYTQRLYHPQNHTLQKSSSDSLWGLSGYDTTDRFSTRRSKGETPSHVGPGTYMKQAQWEKPHNRDEITTPSSMFKSASDRTLKGIPKDYDDIIQINRRLKMIPSSEHHRVPIGSSHQDFHALKGGTNGFAFGKDPRKSWVSKEKASPVVVVRTANNSSYTSTALSDSFWGETSHNSPSNRSFTQRPQTSMASSC